MNTQEFEELCLEIVKNLKPTSPIDTGNLRYDGIRYEFVDATTFRIYVDEKIAPYMPYTNEPWISPKWNGKQNPNEGWWENKALPSIVKTIREKFKRNISAEIIK